uniref:Uncharacterized protein n=1 Tax=Romanomermis culicivorax TaxID=13658 RepID=A0A915IYR4_ROMCU
MYFTGHNRPLVPITGVVPASKRPSTAVSHTSTQRTPSRTSQLTEPHHHLPSTNSSNKSGSFCTVTRIDEPGYTSPTATSRTVVPNLNSSLTTRSDSPDARSVDSGGTQDRDDYKSALSPVFFDADGIRL